MSRAHRPSTTPMDFEWSNQTGPVDSRSPFLTAGQQSQAGIKRPHSVLDSPSKSNGYNGSFATPNRSGYFTANKPLPTTPASSLPAHIQSQTWEPRTPATNYDFSSGGETPNTPHMDSDTGTPDTQLAAKMGLLGETSTRKPARRDSWMAIKGFFGASPSPSKSERDRDRDGERERDRNRDRDRDRDRDRRDTDRDRELRRPASSRKEKEGRIVKRRSERSEQSRSKKRHALHRPSDDSDTETPSTTTTTATNNKNPPKVVQVVQETFIKRLGNLFHWLEAHPALPTVLSIYAQFLINTVLGAGFLYIIYCAWAGIMSDVDIESSKHTAEVMVEISACATDYQRNHCGTPNMAPALEAVCGVWEACMGRDPRKVARASVTAKTFAMIFNSFVEEFSYKSMIFTAIVIFGGFNLSNWAFGWMRSSPSHSPSHNHNAQDYPHPPQTPHRSLSTPYQQHPLQNDAHFQGDALHNSQHWAGNWRALPAYAGAGDGSEGGGQLQLQMQTPGRQGAEFVRELEDAGGLGVGVGAGKTVRKRGLFR